MNINHKMKHKMPHDQSATEIQAQCKSKLAIVACYTGRMILIFGYRVKLALSHPNYNL